MNNEYVIKKETLQSIGNAIRSLNGDENLLSPSTMANNLTDFKTNLDATITGQDQLINQLVLKTNKLLAAHNALQSNYNNLLIDYQNKINELETEKESWAGALTFSGTYATSTYYTAAGCSLAVDKQKGMAFITVQGGTSTTYENIYFTALQLPDGVTMLATPGGTTGIGFGTGGATKNYFTAVLTGITGKIDVAITMSTLSGTSYDAARCDLTVTYV